MTVSVTLCITAMAAQGGVIGQWIGSGRSWNSPNFTKINAGLTAAGNTIPADAAITAANLSLYDSFLIGEPSSTPTAAEISALAAWLLAGGQLLLFNDGSSNASNANAILSGVGSTMSVGGSMDQNMFLTGSIYAVTTPNNVAGQFLSGTPGQRVSGGTNLTTGGAGWTASQIADAEAYIHYEQLGLGFVIAFGDRLDHDYFSLASGSPRLNFFTNLGAFDNVGLDGAPTGPDPVPEPTTIITMAAGVIGLLTLRRRRA
jgi:hypothetical protein